MLTKTSAYYDAGRHNTGGVALQNQIDAILERLRVLRAELERTQSPATLIVIDQALSELAASLPDPSLSSCLQSACPPTNKGSSFSSCANHS